MSESTSQTNEVAKKGGIIPRSQLYSVISAHTKEAIETLVQLMKSGHPNVRLGAAKALLDKAVPDLKSMEVGGRDGQPLQVQVMTYGSNDPLLTYITGPTSREVYQGDLQRPASIPGSQLAPEGTQNNNSNQSVNSMGQSS